MRIAIGLLAAFFFLSLPAIGGAAEEAASFTQRWPETPFREASMIEKIRFVASVGKENIELVLQANLPGTAQKAPQCMTEFCELLGLH